MNKSADNYGRIVAQLNSRWRVIECRHLIQWILQYRASAETYATSRWVGRTYCRTRNGLLRCCREHAGAIDRTATEILAALPERIEDVDRKAVITTRTISASAAITIYIDTS